MTTGRVRLGAAAAFDSRQPASVRMIHEDGSLLGHSVLPLTGSLVAHDATLRCTVREGDWSRRGCGVRTLGAPRRAHCDDAQTAIAGIAATREYSVAGAECCRQPNGTGTHGTELESPAKPETVNRASPWIRRFRWRLLARGERSR